MTPVEAVLLMLSTLMLMLGTALFTMLLMQWLERYRK